MTIAASVLTTALGAILYWAVDYSVSGVDLKTIGVILMVAGLAGLLLSAIASMRHTHSEVVVQDAAGRIQSQQRSDTKTV
jgi:hypothetical protein